MQNSNSDPPSSNGIDTCPTPPLSREHGLETLIHRLNEADVRINRERSSQSFSVNPKKVSGIIQNWRIEFDGTKQGMRMDEFLYRVRSLTKQNLGNDYHLLNDHLYLLDIP